MGNTVRTIVHYLQSPVLVRSVQERLGVKQIHVKTADEDEGVTTANAASSSASRANGVIRRDDAGSGGNLPWLAIKRRKRLKLPSSPEASPPPSPDIIVETIPVLDIFFRLATELGYEPFYITVIPFFIWNVDTFITRHVVVLWIGSMYMAQACKALFKMKRPASPPAIRLELNPSLETEYGFPSGHATVSTTIPFYFAYRAFLRYEACNYCMPCILHTVHVDTFVFRFHCGLGCLLHASGVGLCVSVESTWAFTRLWLVL